MFDVLVLDLPKELSEMFDPTKGKTLAVNFTFITYAVQAVHFARRVNFRVVQHAPAVASIITCCKIKTENTSDVSV